jgi:hypothetical protein
MSSAAEAELGALCVTAKELVPIRLTLTQMGWKQPVTPIQTDNTTAEGVVNSTIICPKEEQVDGYKILVAKMQRFSTTI